MDPSNKESYQEECSIAVRKCSQNESVIGFLGLRSTKPLAVVFFFLFIQGSNLSLLSSLIM